MTALNGRLPASMLAVVPGTAERVLAQLATQTAAMRDAFASAHGSPLDITDAYRTFEAQVRVKADKGFLAAKPGTSNHGWATALDLGSGVEDFGSPAHEWMRANAFRFGFVHPAWAEPDGFKPEAWHWETSTVPVSPAAWTTGRLDQAPHDTAPEEDDVSLLIQSPSEGIWLLDGGLRHPVSDERSRDGLLARFGGPVPVSDEFLRAVPRAGTSQLLLVQADGRGIGLLTGGGFVPVQELETVAMLQAAGVALRPVAPPAFDALAAGSH